MPFQRKIWSRKKTFARQFSIGKKNPKLRNIITRDRISRWKSYKLIFHLFCHFWGKKYFAIFNEKSLFYRILRKGLVVFLQNCLVATATGTGATRFVSVAVNGLRKAEPQLQLQQRHKLNMSLLQLQSHQGTSSAHPCCSCSLYKKSLVENHFFYLFHHLFCNFWSPKNNFFCLQKSLFFRSLKITFNQLSFLGTLYINIKCSTWSHSEEMLYVFNASENAADS